MNKENQPIYKRIDTHFRFLGDNGHEGLTRVRIYNTIPPVAIASELPDNPGQSVTNAAEFLWPQIIRAYLPERMEDETPAIMVEHYSHLHDSQHNDYSQVLFEKPTPRIVSRNRRQMLSYGEPDWLSIGREELVGMTGDESL